MRFFRTGVVAAGLGMAAGAFCLASVSNAQPQKIPQQEIGDRATVRVVPGERYRAGALHRMVFGDHWRSLWTSPMNVDILDLDTFAGGLKPFRKGGGFQTISLRFKGADGREYRFRTVDKDPARGMPEKLRNTLVSDVVQDQVSTANPAGAAVVQPFLDAAGILSASARFVVLPYDREALGEFYEEFAGLFGAIEEHPDENDGPRNAFAGASKVTGTYSMLEKLDEDNGNIVDAKAYLKARLVDLFIGDWDRHSGQWRWAGYPADGKTLWKPVPKDRDNAFSRQDGPFSWVITQLLPQIEGFGEDMDNVYFLSWSGRPLDRRIFPLLDRREWDEVTRELLQVLDDERIDDAVRRMPAEMYRKEGERLSRALKARRDLLDEASGELYMIYAGDVDIHASDMPEYARVERHADGKVSVGIYRYDAAAEAREPHPFYFRIFDPAHTREVRVYLMGGDDRADISGRLEGDMDVRIIGGDGDDSFADMTTPSSAGSVSGGRNYLYDSGDKTVFQQARRSVVDTRPFPEPGDEKGKYDLKPRDYGHELDASIANLKLDYAPEYGAFLGWGVILEDYGFRRDPYNFRMKLGGGVAAGSELRYKLEYEGDFRSFFDGAELRLEAGTTGLDIINFYGFGNESSFDKSRYDEDDFEIKQQVSWLRPSLHFPANADFQVRVGLEAKFVDLEVDEGSRLEALDPYGIDHDFAGAFIAGIRYDSRDCGEKILLSPRKQLGRLAGEKTSCGTAAQSGMALDLEGAWYPEFFGNDEAFGKVSAEGTVYLPLSSLPHSRLALRAGGEKIWGDYPFYEAAYIGGSRSVRGFDKQRFAGDASLYGNSELRLYAGSFKFLVPVMFGPLAFIETGRVFYDGEDSDRWHTGYGGGLWFAFIEPRYVLSVSAGKGIDSGRLTDDMGIYLRTGFTF
ncbi:hypothetical protein CHL67_06570 [Prosthecochloris sp. GSB1]|uniref:BamA/TamA family outer membrane protein n=1 Tax=Prosthecochloris sp. GSB1 TaxID=281093 RepID=UPI000B8CD7E1|nr:BamA/TamA family outer membrane protein [Prosthecochloris sp. GSB1]ASQ90632.1 hypothetical protein CHL67_06570 [Prosthecochloris sp. GSB1]